MTRSIVSTRTFTHYPTRTELPEGYFLVRLTSTPERNSRHKIFHRTASFKGFEFVATFSRRAEAKISLAALIATEKPGSAKCD